MFIHPLTLLSFLSSIHKHTLGIIYQARIMPGCGSSLTSRNLDQFRDEDKEGAHVQQGSPSGGEAPGGVGLRCLSTLSQGGVERGRRGKRQVKGEHGRKDTLGWGNNVYKDLQVGPGKMEFAGTWCTSHKERKSPERASLRVGGTPSSRACKQVSSVVFTMNQCGLDEKFSCREISWCEFKNNPSCYNTESERETVGLGASALVPSSSLLFTKGRALSNSTCRAILPTARSQSP